MLKDINKQGLAGGSSRLSVWEKDVQVVIIPTALRTRSFAHAPLRVYVGSLLY